MRQFLGTLLFFSCLLFSCRNDVKETASTADAEDRYEYKRYTGTIAREQVVLNLYFHYRGADNLDLRGNYFYKGKSQVIDLYPAGSQTTGNSDLRLSEFVETEIDDDKESPEWTVTLDGDKIKGWWKSADRKTMQQVDLVENYDGASEFMYITGEDSVSIKSKSNNYKMTDSYVLMIPNNKTATEDVAFIEYSMGQELGGDSLAAASLHQYVVLKNKSDFKDYLNIKADLINSNETQADEGNNWQTTVTNTCRYNDRRLLVFEVTEYSFMGEDAEFSQSKYICLDLDKKKVWHLSDIMTVDTSKLRSLLDSEAHKLYNIGAEDALSKALKVDSLPLSTNIAISDVGITFYYSIAEISEDKANIFIPYIKLDALLTPEFKERMKLPVRIE